MTMSVTFNRYVSKLAELSWPQGYDLSDTDAPDSLKKLKREFQSRQRITVYSGSSDSTIFADARVNQDFRAWHDFCHLMLDAPFDLTGESLTCELQVKQLKHHMGVDHPELDYCIKLLEAEIIGQALYFHRNRGYISNQAAFVAAYIENPCTALDRQW